MDGSLRTSSLRMIWSRQNGFTVDAFFAAERNESPPSSKLVRGPAAIDRQRRSGDRFRMIRTQKNREAAKLLDGHKTFGGLGGEQHVADDFLLGDAAGLG